MGASKLDLAVFSKKGLLDKLILVINKYYESI